MPSDNPFKWRQFEPGLILLCVRWYLRYAVSYRDLEEMMRERGLCVDHTTIYRWVQRYAPEIAKRCRPFLRRTTDSYRIDETYVRVGGAWRYLYRGVDSNGDTLDFLLRGALAGFVEALRVTYNDIEVHLDLEPELGLADNGDLDQDLPALLLAAGAAAEQARTVLSIFVDELQYVDEDGLAALITALHHAAIRRSPVVLIGAGLPQLRARLGRAKSYAERLFDFPEVGALPPEAARRAIENPAQAQGVTVADEALECIIETTQGYPYFLQEWGKHAWNAADASPIDLDDVERASATATAALDESFFRVRFDRLTGAERRYLRAMAELGPGPHRSGDIAAVLGRDVKSLGPTRNQLIRKGMVWSPGHGDTAFTVPLFDQFMCRVMTGDWRQ